MSPAAYQRQRFMHLLIGFWSRKAPQNTPGFIFKVPPDFGGSIAESLANLDLISHFFVEISQKYH